MKAYRTEKQRQASADAAADQVLRTRLKALSGVLDGGEEVAVRLGMSAATFYRRIQHPAKLTVAEVRAIQRLEARLGLGNYNGSEQMVG